MATRSRRLPPPPSPPPPPAPPSVIKHPGKKSGSWLPELEKEMLVACVPTAKTGKEKGSSLLPETEPEKEKPLARLAPAIAPGDLANPGKESAPCLPALEKEGEAKEKPLSRPDPANTSENLANPVKKKRRPVPAPPMTDKERNKIKRVKELHGKVVEDLRELLEERADLRKTHDEFVFWRRCVAARLVNRIVFQRRDADYVRRQLDLGLKLGDKLPEELKKAREPISKALFMWSDMGRALQLGMDRFIAEYSNPEECKKRIRRDCYALAGLDENGVPLKSVDQK